MEGDFRRILALVDYCDTSVHAAEEAALIASKFYSELHLLHVSSNSNSSHLIVPDPFFPIITENGEEVYYTNFDKLEQIKRDLDRDYDVSISCFEVRGKFLENVKRHIDEFQADLIVMGANKENWFKELFFESKAKSIIKNVECEVLCVYPESNSKRLKKIVLPIGKFIPKRKIRLAYELARKFAANVHLISLTNNGNSLSTENTRILMASYQYLKDINNIPIECRTVTGINLAQATIQYAENIEADLILINADAESDLSGKVLRKWGGNIVNHSTIPVLSVHAINDKSKHKLYRA
jgi:nucleotide-binding universal stress UspA family protein